MSMLIGVDLSGPSNPSDTACAVCEQRGSTLHLVRLYAGLSDRELLSVVQRHAAADLTIGLDAPLSYEDGGGDRARDKALRNLLTSKGLPSGTVMTPTMTRMAYLTLRGVQVAGMLRQALPEARIVEVHPFGSLVLAGLDPELAVLVKRDRTALANVLKALPALGLRNLPVAAGSDHEVAAIGAAHAAWRWHNNSASWSCPADPPHHPFPMAC